MNKTKIEIINDTADYYGGNPMGRRGVADDGCCTILTDDGRMCAIGRLLHKAARKKYLGNTIPMEWELPLEEFKPEYRDAVSCLEFRSDLRLFHDDPLNWDEIELTELGQDHLELLRIKYRGE